MLNCSGVGVQGAPVLAGGLEHDGLCAGGGPQERNPGEAMSVQEQLDASVGRRPEGPDVHTEKAAGVVAGQGCKVAGR